MKLTLTFFLVIFFAFTSIAQPCLPNGTTLSTQFAVDNFQSMYPGCTEIGGDLIIKRNTSSSDPITSLEGLNVITSIGGELKLIALAGNYPLLLTDFSGLDNLTTIGGDLTIHNTLAGDLSGLESLTTIGGDVGIIFNDSLTSLTAMQNVSSFSGDLYIAYNDALSQCEAQWVCDFLSNPTGTVDIFYNAEGCNSPPEIADACGITLSCLPYGNYRITSQNDIDNFISHYQNCTDISGFMEVNGEDVTNLNGLNQLTSVAGNLRIGNSDYGNPLLTSLDGLENLQSVGGDLEIWSNANLGDIDAISSVDYVGGDLKIGRSDVLTNLNALAGYTSIGGGLSIGINASLTDIFGLINLTSLGPDGWISIQSNPLLTNLYGLDAIDAGTIQGLTIRNNNLLSTCEAMSICGYLAAPGGSTWILNNAPGCNTPEEVQEACESVGIGEQGEHSVIQIWPNPASGTLFIETNRDEPISQVTLFDHLGRVQMQMTDVTGPLNISMLDEGLYILEALQGDQTSRQKLIIQ